jgi:hypothetical protein
MVVPPAISTFPEGKSVAVATSRAVFMTAVSAAAAKLLVAGS